MGSAFGKDIVDKVQRVMKCLRDNGVRYTWRWVKDKLRCRREFRTMAARPLYTEAQLQTQREHKFPREVKFSIAVPLYNTPESFLREMIASVQEQTYADWELCLADGSDDAHAYVGRVCGQYASKDPRVRYQKLAENKGISENTNACVDMATGGYIGLLDHDDLLHPAALYNVMEAICEQGADFVYTDENTFREKPADAYYPHFKPDYAPDTLRANNYICHFTVFDRGLLNEIGGGFRSGFDGSQDYDLVLRLTEKAKKIIHIPKILYYWRAHAQSVAEDVRAKPYVIQAAHLAIEEHLKRVGLKGEVMDTVVPSMYRVKYDIAGVPLVSILIPNKDHAGDLKRCLESIFRVTVYRNFEIIVIENNSAEDSTFVYYQQIQEKWPNVHVIAWDGGCNCSAINNYGAKNAKGEYYLLLSNDTEIITPDWIEELLMYVQRDDVAAAGAKLYYPDDTIQHAGIILGMGADRVAGYPFYRQPGDALGYMGRLCYAQDMSAVTAACMLVKAELYWKVSGFDEDFAETYSGVDFCLKLRRLGYLIVWTPYAELYHYESKPRGFADRPDDQERLRGEVERFQKRWAKELAAGDPYYNPNFTLDWTDFSLRLRNDRPSNGE